MKTINYILAVSVVGLLACGEEDKEEKLSTEEVPEGLHQVFRDGVADAQEVEWQKDGENFEVEYVQQGLKKELVYDVDGGILEKTTEVSISQVPANISAYIEEKYTGATIDIVESVATLDKNFFEVELTHDGKEIELIFDVNGAFLEEERD